MFQFKANFCVKNHFNLFEIDFIEGAVNDVFFRFNFLISLMIDISSSTNFAKLSQIQGLSIIAYIEFESDTHKEMRSINFPFPYEDGSRAVMGVKC